MSISKHQADGAEDSKLLVLPSELLVHIYCEVPTLIDVFSLAATCNQLRSVWIAHVRMIYLMVAPRCVAHESFARSLLTEGPTLTTLDESFLGLDEVLSIMKNMATLEGIISRFENEVVRRVKCKYSLFLWDRYSVARNSVKSF